MSSILPFRALRPHPFFAGKICEPPYDVMSSDEAREIALTRSLSFLKISKPEIDLPPETDPCSPEVYAKGAENFKKCVLSEYLKQDSNPGFYLYRQSTSDHSQTGIVALASCEEYDQNIIKRHELTRPDKEDDRVRHIEALQSQTGPAFLAYPAQEEIDALVALKTALTPDIQFTGDDGVTHTSWSLFDIADIQFLKNRFAQIPNLYIADGHHRSAAAARISKKYPDPEHPSHHFLAVIFPHSQLRILPYNRLVKDLNSLTPQNLMEKLSTVGTLRPSKLATPSAKHQICIFLQQKWHSFHWHPHIVSGENPLEQLDVSLLQKHVLQPFLDIDNPRTSSRIAFVGGSRGTQELEREILSGRWSLAFSMYPTAIEDLMQIADRNQLMPPKSTWFDPKLRDGMFCHMIA